MTRFGGADAWLSMQRAGVGQGHAQRETVALASRREPCVAAATGAGGERVADRAHGRVRAGHGQPVLIQVRPQTNLSPDGPLTSLKRSRLPSSFQRAVKVGPFSPSSLITSLKIE